MYFAAETWHHADTCWLKCSNISSNTAQSSTTPFVSQSCKSVRCIDLHLPLNLPSLCRELRRHFVVKLTPTVRLAQFLQYHTLSVLQSASMEVWTSSVPEWCSQPLKVSSIWQLHCHGPSNIFINITISKNLSLSLSLFCSLVFIVANFTSLKPLQLLIKCKHVSF